MVLPLTVIVCSTDLSDGRGLGRACVCSGGLGVPGGGVGAPGAGAVEGVVAAGVCDGAAAGVEEGFCWLPRWPRWAATGRVMASRSAGVMRLKVMQRIVLDCAREPTSRI